jgi:hypothetical protein
MFWRVEERVNIFGRSAEVVSGNAHRINTYLGRHLPDRSLTSVCMLHSRYHILAVRYHYTRIPGVEEAVVCCFVAAIWTEGIRR